MFITCGNCQEKDITASTTLSETSIDCECGFHFEEIHEITSKIITIPNSFQARFEVYYSKAGYDEQTFNYYYYSETILLAENTSSAVIVMTSYQTNTVENIETRIYEYEVHMETNVNGLPYAQVVDLGTITIVLNYLAKTVTIS